MHELHECTSEPATQTPQHSSQHTTPALAHSLTHSRCRTPSPPGLTPCLTLTGTSSGHPPLLVPNPGLVAPILFFLLKVVSFSSLLKNFVGNNCSLFTHSLTHSLSHGTDGVVYLQDRGARAAHSLYKVGASAREGNAHSLGESIVRHVRVEIPRGE